MKAATKPLLQIFDALGGFRIGAMFVLIKIDKGLRAFVLWQATDGAVKEVNMLARPGHPRAEVRFLFGSGLAKEQPSFRP